MKLLFEKWRRHLKEEDDLESPVIDPERVVLPDLETIQAAFEPEDLESIPVVPKEGWSFEGHVDLSALAHTPGAVAGDDPDIIIRGPDGVQRTYGMGDCIEGLGCIDNVWQTGKGSRVSIMPDEGPRFAMNIGPGKSKRTDKIPKGDQGGAHHHWPKTAKEASDMGFVLPWDYDPSVGAVSLDDEPYIPPEGDESDEAPWLDAIRVRLKGLNAPEETIELATQMCDVGDVPCLKTVLETLNQEDGDFGGFNWEGGPEPYEVNENKGKFQTIFENWRKFEKKVLRDENLARGVRALNEWDYTAAPAPGVTPEVEPEEIEVEPFIPDPDFEKTSVDSVEQVKQWYEPGGQRFESWMNFLTSRVGEEEATRIYDEDVLPRIYQRLEGVEIYQAGDPRADSKLAVGAGGHFSRGDYGSEGEILISDPPWYHFRDLEGWLGDNPREENILTHELGHALEKTRFPGLRQRKSPTGVEREVWVDNLEDFHSVVGQAGTGETYQPMPYGMYDDEKSLYTHKTNDSYEKAKGQPFPGTWVQITPAPPPREIDPRAHNREVLRKLFPGMPSRYKGGPGRYAGGEEAGSNPQWHVVDGEVITDIYNLGLLDKEKVEDLMSAVPGTDTYFGDRRAPWNSWPGYIPDDLLRALKYYKNPDLTTDEVLKLLKSIVKVDPAQNRKGQEYQPSAQGREVVVEQKEELQLIFENWRNYLNEGIDPEIIEHIRKTIEEKIEIPVSKMYLLENSTVLAHLQVDLNEHSSELMPLIHERWESSEELKQIKEMGYDVRLGVVGEGIDASSVPLTKELL